MATLVCPQCEDKFSWAAELEIHLLETHSAYQFEEIGIERRRPEGTGPAGNELVGAAVGRTER
jgi:hypothetical protein